MPHGWLRAAVVLINQGLLKVCRRLTALGKEKGFLALELGRS